MNHRRDRLARRASRAPTVALVNNAQREHQEFMGSVEAVARARTRAVYDALPADGVAVVNADDAHAPTVARSRAGARARRRLRRSTQRPTSAARYALERAGERAATCARRPGEADATLAHRRACTTCATRSPPRPARIAAGIAARRDRAQGLERVPPGHRPPAASSSAASGATRDRRQLQRQPRLGARRDRRARRAARRRAVLVLGDMGEVGDAGAGVPSRGRRLRARSAASTRLLALGDADARTRSTAFGAGARTSTTSTR